MATTRKPWSKADRKTLKDCMLAANGDSMAGYKSAMQLLPGRTLNAIQGFWSRLGQKPMRKAKAATPPASLDRMKTMLTTAIEAGLCETSEYSIDHNGVTIKF